MTRDQLIVWPREKDDALVRVRTLLAEWDQPFEKDSTTFGVKYVRGWDAGLIQCREELRAALNGEAYPMEKGMTAPLGAHIDAILGGPE